MPALANPRHEAFAQAIFAGLTGKTRIERAQSTAYLEAYPSCSPGPAAWTNASRLLRRAKVWERIGELQAEANKRLEPKIDLSRERIGRRLHLASQMAEQDRNPNGIQLPNSALPKSSIPSTHQIPIILTSNLHNPCKTLDASYCRALASLRPTMLRFRPR